MTHSFKKEVKIFKSVYLFIFSKIKKMDVSVSCDPPSRRNKQWWCHLCRPWVEWQRMFSECSVFHMTWWYHVTRLNKWPTVWSFQRSKQWNPVIYWFSFPWTLSLLLHSSPPCKQSPDIFGIDSPQVSFLSPSFPSLSVGAPGVTGGPGLGWDEGAGLR